MGADGITIDELPLGTEIAVSVAMTGEAYVLSDIATATFGSLMAAPPFCAPFYSGQEPVPRVTGAAHPAAGHFYYLGMRPHLPQVRPRRRPGLVPRRVGARFGS